MHILLCLLVHVLYVGNYKTLINLRNLRIFFLNQPPHRRQSRGSLKVRTLTIDWLWWPSMDWTLTTMFTNQYLLRGLRGEHTASNLCYRGRKFPPAWNCPPLIFPLTKWANCRITNSNILHFGSYTKKWCKKNTSDEKLAHIFHVPMRAIPLLLPALWIVWLINLVQAAYISCSHAGNTVNFTSSLNCLID